MERDDVWRAIDGQRRATVAMLEDLSEAEWRHPSLCEGWTVRDVAAHLALQNTTLTMMPRAVLAMVRHRGLDGGIRAMAVDHARQPTEQIVAEIRDRIGVWRALPSVTYREAAIDYLVHAQDIALPLGRTIAMPPDVSAVAADRAWTSARMFHARKRLAGYRFVATDTDWAEGEGPEVTGAMGALLLLFTGRRAALTQLDGPGLRRLTEQLTPTAPGTTR